MLPVVLNHAGVPGFSGGFVGVDIFFVISGYLITGILRDDIEAGRYSLLRFYDRRVRRILPALFAVLGACFVVGYFRLIPIHYEEFGQSAIATLLFVSNIWFWAEATDYFATDTAFEPLLHTWSLAVEEQFYLLFPPVLWLLMTRLRRWMYPVLGALALVSFVASANAVEAAPVSAFYLTPHRIWELQIGMFLALLGGRVAAPPLLREGAGLLGLLAIAAAIVTYDDATPFPGPFAALPCLGAAALIWSGTGGSTRANRLLSTAPLVWIGLISYSLYLWHWPVLAFLRIQAGSTELPADTLALAVVGSFAAAALSWRFVERPFRRNSAGAWTPKTSVLAAGAATAIFVSIAAVVDQSDGLPGRVPQEVMSVYDASRVWKMPSGCRTPDFRKPGCATSAERVDLLVWGDSHSGALWDALSDAARERGIAAAISYFQGCAPLMGILRASTEEADTCERSRKAVLASILASHDVGTVLLHARWPVWAEQSQPPWESRLRLNLREAGAGAGPASDAAPVEVFERGLRRTVEALRGSGREVIILGGVPEIDWLVPEGLAYAAWFGTQPPAAPTIEDIRARHGNADAVLARLAEETGATFLSVTERICIPECPVAADGHGLYNDHSHLNPAGARRLLLPLILPHL